jgi:hypothetical protein
MADVILYIVDQHSLSSILNTPISQILTMLNSQIFQKNRPPIYNNFHRDFDVDLEGDLLELFDSNPDMKVTNQSPLVYESELKSDLILLLAKWSSVAQWSCWDARLFLYIVPYIDRDISDTSDFLSPKIWSSFQNAISLKDQDSFVESVILDWMNRREKLGETMEPSEDPKILPTMSSHGLLSKSLFNFIKYSLQHDLGLLIGREYLDSKLWNLYENNILDYRG